MSVDALVEEARGLPEELIMNVLRYARALKLDYEADHPAVSYDSAVGWYREPGLLKGQIIMSDDFDEPLDDFAEYM